MNALSPRQMVALQVACWPTIRQRVHPTDTDGILPPHSSITPVRPSRAWCHNRTLTSGSCCPNLRLAGWPLTLVKPMTIIEIDESLVLRGVNDAPILAADTSFAPARFLIHEWRDYAIEWKDTSAPCGQLIVTGPPRRTRVGNGVLFRFENQLGLARLNIRSENVVVPLVVEVLSLKYREPQKYRAFYDRLVEELSDRAATLPFSIQAPTALRTRESTRPSSDLFVWHFLRRDMDKVLAALRVVIREPRRLLTAEDAQVALDQVTAVELDCLPELIGRPADLQPAPTDGAASGWRLAAALQQRRTGRRFLPAQLRVSRAEETLDTPEHRFVHAFVEELSNAIERLLRKFDLPQEESRRLGTFWGELRDALHATFLAEVGPMSVFPAASRVLQRVYGYRELLRFWRELHLASDPFWSLDCALDVRDVPTLYEWWCFFELIGRLGTLRSLVQLDVRFDEVGGLPYGVAASFEDGWELVFNQSFSRSSRRWPSYSLPLRPDFILTRANVPLVALDAKFRFDQADWPALEAVEEDEASGFALSPDRGGIAERLAKRVDIYKMHTYRDALRLKASIVLYPGRECDDAPFYPFEAGGPHLCRLDSFLGESTPAGVGAIPLSPEG